MNFRKLFSNEDLLAVWIGVIILALVSLFHFSQYDTVKESYDLAVTESVASGSTESVSVKSMEIGAAKTIKSLVATPKKWETSPLDSICPEGKSTLLVSMLGLFVFILVLFGTGVKLMGESFRKFAVSLAAIFLITIVSFVLAGQKEVSYLGVNYAIWAIAIGIIISNTVGVPKWLKPAIRSEYYIKTGLVIMGAEILISKILAIGLPGIFVAWIVTPIVLIVTYIFGQKVLKLKSKSLNMTICADMSVCGVSAAIATASATKAKKEELTIAITLSMIFTVVMMVVLPMIAKSIGLSEVIAGAWLGGTLDSTGAVVAAGNFIGDTALNVAATIKMIQNVLIGVVAFFVALYWAIYVERTPNAPRPKPIEIWTRFPKFLLGFIGMSIVFSLLYSNLDKSMASAMIDNGIIKGFTKDFKDWLFCLAFVCIGLNTNFKEFSKHIQGTKHITLYCCGQLFNILLTLGMAYLMFEIVFPEITAKI
ncbi:MAG: putative sulfate exporter family transporter [Rikenellaceae bacterium]